jgi:hypothetical protein
VIPEQHGMKGKKHACKEGKNNNHVGKKTIIKPSTEENNHEVPLSLAR